MVTSIGLIYKVLLPSVSTFETPLAVSVCVESAAQSGSAQEWGWRLGQFV